MLVNDHIFVNLRTEPSDKCKVLASICYQEWGVGCVPCEPDFTRWFDMAMRALEKKQRMPSIFDWLEDCRECHSTWCEQQCVLGKCIDLSRALEQSKAQ